MLEVIYDYGFLAVFVIGVIPSIVLGRLLLARLRPVWLFVVIACMLAGFLFYAFICSSSDHDPFMALGPLFAVFLISIVTH